MREAKEAIEVLKKLLKDITNDWKDRKNRDIVQVFLSLPSVSTSGTTDLLSDAPKIDLTNFVGNIVIYIPLNKVTLWMDPYPANPSPFHYPEDRLLRFFGFIPDSPV